MRTECIPVYLPRDEYIELERIAKAEERDPFQHARWILRRAITQAAHEPSTVTKRAGDDRIDS